jgi:hypothetical protein
VLPKSPTKFEKPKIVPFTYWELDARPWEENMRFGKFAALPRDPEDPKYMLDHIRPGPSTNAEVYEPYFDNENVWLYTEVWATFFTPRSGAKGVSIYNYFMQLQGSKIVITKKRPTKRLLPVSEREISYITVDGVKKWEEPAVVGMDNKWVKPKARLTASSSNLTCRERVIRTKMGVAGRDWIPERVTKAKEHWNPETTTWKSKEERDRIMPPFIHLTDLEGPQQESNAREEPMDEQMAVETLQLGQRCEKRENDRFCCAECKALGLEYLVRGALGIVNDICCVHCPSQEVCLQRQKELGHHISSTNGLGFERRWKPVYEEYGCLETTWPVL